MCIVLITQNVPVCDQRSPFFDYFNLIFIENNFFV